MKHLLTLLIGACFALFFLSPATSAELHTGPPVCGPTICVLNSAGGALADWLPWYFENGHKQFVIPAGATCNSMCAGFAVWKVTHDADKGLANWRYDGQLCWCHQGVRDEFVMVPLEQHGYGRLVQTMLKGDPFKVPK